MKLLFVLFLLFSFQLFSQQKSEIRKKHSLVVSGQKTMEVDETSYVVWEYKGGSKDVAKLKNGNYLITFKDHVVEVTCEKKVVWEYKRSINDEFMSA